MYHVAWENKKNISASNTYLNWVLLLGTFGKDQLPHGKETVTLEMKEEFHRYVLSLFV